MKLALDLLGGDHGPQEVVKAANLLLSEGAVDQLFLVGPKEAAKTLQDPEDSRVQWVATDTYIAMNDHPAQAYRTKKDASITLASRLVKEGKADALVSCGSTGAQLAAGLFEIGRIKGISRPAIAAPLPNMQGGFTLLCDAGANTDATDEQLQDFARMGSICYTILNAQETLPRVGLINNGSEENKGPEQMQRLYPIFAQDPAFDFRGFAEGNKLLVGDFDVLVTDGFTGNVVLKTLEGTASALVQALKTGIMGKKRYQLAGLSLKPVFRGLKEQMDPNRIGGAPLLGIQGVSVVCHGHSHAEAIYHGAFVAKRCVEAGLVDQIAAHIHRD